MATNQTESDPTGNQELPTPEFSEQATSSTSSGADEIVSKLLPHLEQIIERKVQSTKDKRISEIEKVLGGRSKILAELQAAGVEVPKDVLTDMRLRELEEQRTDPTTQRETVSDNGLSQQRTAVTEAIAELEKYELDQNDSAFLELLRGKYQNRAAFDLAVQRHIVNKLKPTKPANLADVVQAPASARNHSLSDEEREKIAGRLIDLQREPTKNAKEIESLRAQLKG